MKDDTISRAAALTALGEEPPVWYDGEDEIAERNQWRRDVAAIKALPPAQPDVPDTNVGDMISRQAALNSPVKMVSDGLEWVPVYHLRELPSAQPGWIPVTEKPIEGGQYIVTLKDDKEVWTDIAEWNPTFGGRWQAEFFDCEYRDIDNVLAWQPLPTPYREGGQS